MPEITLPAIGLYELLVAGSAAITAYYYATPQGQRAREQAARDAQRALDEIKEGLKRKPEPEPEPKPDPKPIPPLVPRCDEDCRKPKKCPVCGKPVAPGQVMSEAPAYVPPQCPPPGRTPLDKETVLARPDFSRVKGRQYQGAQIYRGADDQIYYRDNFHVGNAAEIEVFDSRGKKHQGTICPNCGQMRGGPESDKKPVL